MSKYFARPVRAECHDKPRRNDEVPEDESLEAPALPAAINRRQVASWSASMLVHTIVLLVLALVTFSSDVIDAATELVMPLEDVPEKLNDDPIPEVDIPNPLNEQREQDAAPPPPTPEIDAADIGTSDVDPASEAFAAVVPSMEFAKQLIGLPVPGGGLDEPWGSQGSFGLRIDCPKPQVTQSAVEAALRWLSEHQNRDGSWSFNHTPGGRCSGFANPGSKKSRMGATGLALLPFLGTGYTHKEGKYKQVVRRGLDYLVGHMIVRSNTGRLFEADGSSHEHMYCHGIAACALAEAFGMTNEHRLRSPAQLAINYIVQAQDPDGGGWIYTPRTGGDTSVVGWQVLALKSAILSHLNVPGRVKPLASKWLDSVQSELPDVNYGIGSRYGYRRPGDRDNSSAACTAIGLICRNYLGTPRDDPGLRMGVEWLAQRAPSTSDMYYNYYAAMVMYQNDGPRGKLWLAWDRAMKNHLVGTQVSDGRDRGSWHFSGNHGDTGGRLYNTALAAMTLEVYYRYLPVYQQKNLDEDFPQE